MASFWLAGCHRTPLVCRSEYLYPTYLASKQVKTPDLYYGCFYGQQIVIYWNLPRSAFYKPVELILHVRYGNRELDTLTIPLKSSRGYWVYRLVNEEYWCRDGILAFQAQLCRDGELLEQWSHHLWSEIIDIR